MFWPTFEDRLKSSISNIMGSKLGILIMDKTMDDELIFSSPLFMLKKPEL